MKVSKEARDVVLHRAGGACEYCYLSREASIVPHQVDHIIGRQHQRRHSWQEHLALSPGGRLHGLTPEGRATVQLLDMNDMERVSLRLLLLRRGRHP